MRQLKPADSTLALSKAGAAGGIRDIVPGTDNITISGYWVMLDIYKSVDQQRKICYNTL